MIKEGKSKAYIQYSRIEIQWYTFMTGQGNTLAYIHFRSKKGSA